MWRIRLDICPLSKGFILACEASTPSNSDVGSDWDDDKDTEFDIITKEVRDPPSKSFRVLSPPSVLDLPYDRGTKGCSAPSDTEGAVP